MLHLACQAEGELLLRGGRIFLFIYLIFAFFWFGSENLCVLDRFLQFLPQTINQNKAEGLQRRLSVLIS